MDSVFPFGFPTPTAFYLVLYVLTFVLHQALMHYVLAGSGYLAWCNLVPGAGDTPRTFQPLAAILRDWMPFALSAAITAGVAPLLFVQIVYPTAFYTANLLLWWRWMVVIPILIVAFYLLYLVKSRRYSTWSFPVRTLIAVFIAASFLFVGFCWTANHLISMHQSTWPEIYESGNIAISSIEVTLRVCIWAGGAVPTMCIMAAWQLSAQDNGETRVEERRLGRAALGGLSVATVAGVVYLFQLDELSRGLILGSFGSIYLGIAVVGVILQVVLWSMVLRNRPTRPQLAIVTVGTLLSLIGMSVLREAIRISHLDLNLLLEDHKMAWEIGGFSLFLIMALVNFAIIGLCVVMVRRGLKSKTAE
jgi:hypothetical protein